jgi:hypothetical protein
VTSPLDLLGTWTLSRVVEDRHAGQRLHVEGTLVLATTPVPGATGRVDVSWVEAGVLRRPGADPVAVSRELLVVPRGEGWWVLFSDGGDFHPWQPGGWVDHPCGPDHYRGLVDLSGRPGGGAWTVTWEVSGPLKDYTMTSVLTPA